ncbi:helix-turn-helix domain-containing protein [Robertmurraya kyonggiensis]|uniref:Helix-turn-helix transcriptional regulator n=1 Tax=Robertmurraya kyonggiensis TaxID=1037680 RepID=A0A4U1D0B1_9BACI|nr:helix-turn-helix transcriptional regulator [Robertmurraya kyonggiensis]TKC15709.1 helix-turn-helix transcriptional regulator [Robertmurraya kyonggiensis]
MNVFGERLKELRGNLSLEDLANKLNSKYETNISKSMLSRYENGADPKMENVRVIADYFKVTADYLLGINNDKVVPFNPQLNEKDEKDIQKELQKMIDGLEGKNGYAAFDGNTLEGLDEEDKELLISSLENSLRLAKRLAKQKFTPKKHRD